MSSGFLWDWEVGTGKLNINWLVWISSGRKEEVYLHTPSECIYVGGGAAGLFESITL